jgi:hydroxymethylglutaryl-CoA synthase
MNAGIDVLSFDTAKKHLSFNTLAKAQNTEPKKLEKGLGLIKMTFADTHQHTRSFWRQRFDQINSR